ncbi:uncharacterized protein C16orf90 homolog isoform X1 [Tamandua tetradactyla]|uniref:uncharacterized protein C16orf90 homolog isoform X1 n=1 Tax=Tamandua tetradactyla TaxID=48850 RepID=UPI00405399E4
MPILGIYPREMKTTFTQTCQQKFIVALFIQLPKGKPPKCTSTYEWINKLWHFHTMEYYSAVKRNTTDTQAQGSISSADAVSWARGRPSHPDTPSNIYEGGLGAQQQQCPSAPAPGSKPKNFRLRHLRDLALYLSAHKQPASRCESHWLGHLLARGCLPQSEGAAWALDLPQEPLGPASSSSMDPAKRAPSQPGPPKGLGLRPKRSWEALEESTCPLCKRTCAGTLGRP